MKISVVLNTLNAQKTLEETLKSISNLADEIVVCDDGSSDKTIEIAQKYTKNIFKHESEGFVEPARNFAISKARGDWIFLIDADEEINEKLAKKLKEIAKNDLADFVFIPRKNLIFNKWINDSGWWPDYNIRFFKKGKVVWTDKIHGDPKTAGREFRLDAEENLAILHHNYSSISQFISRLNSYTDVEARQLVEEDYRFDWRDLISKPLSEFINRFFANGGYKDGLHGLVLSMLQSFSFLVTYLKIWEIEGFEEKEIKVEEIESEFGKKSKEIRFWFFKTLWEKSKGSRKIFYKLRQKFAK